jgi:Ca-activated chloride channel family protein
MKLSYLINLKLILIYLLPICQVISPQISVALSANGKGLEGMKLYQNKNFNKASQKFSDALNDKPTDSKLIYNLGNSLYKEGQFEKALQNYSKLVEKETNNLIKQKSTYNMGNTLYRMNKLDESVLAYKKALELDSTDMNAKYNLEFVREQIKNKKKNEEKKDNPEESKDNKNSDKKNNSSQDVKETNKEKNPAHQKEANTKKNQEQKDNQNNPSRTKEIPLKGMSKEEAEHRLSSLSEDIKKFQQKQALDMKSLFNYQGNDW